MDFKKSVYIVRYSAFGDAIHMSHVPRILKEKCGVERIVFETNPKGEQILRNNPYIDTIINIDPSKPPLAKMPVSFLKKRWEQQRVTNFCEQLLVLQDSIERAYIAMEDMNEYYMSDYYRREKFGKLNYYDQTLSFIGLDRFFGEVGEIYFTDDEAGLVDDLWCRQYAGKFVIICNLSGTSKHKLFLNAETIMKSFLVKHVDAVCILMGDESSNRYLSFSGDRIINRAGVFEVDGQKVCYPFRQSMLMASKAQMVIGCESGLMCAATLLGTPVVQLMTAASIKNHGGDFRNDYSLQSPCRCSPCHKGPYDYIGCPKIQHLGEEYPACISFDQDMILQQMERVYADYQRQECPASEMSVVR
jgi:ADP-heptose:LPS heptosyltransferase